MVHKTQAVHNFSSENCSILQTHISQVEKDGQRMNHDIASSKDVAKILKKTQATVIETSNK
jgi:hypothetical protein